MESPNHNNRWTLQERNGERNHQIEKLARTGPTSHGVGDAQSPAS
jgi:hypothetical protein